MKSGPLSSYLIFALVATLIAAAVAYAGRHVAIARGGEEAGVAWLAGCVVCLAASLAAGLLVALSDRLVVPGVTMALGSMLARLVILGLVGTAAVVLVSLAVRPFLLAVAACYLALLVVDTGYALHAASSATDRQPESSIRRL